MGGYSFIFCSFTVFLQIVGACDVGYAFFPGAWAIHLKEWIVCEYGV